MSAAGAGAVAGSASKEEDIYKNNTNESGIIRRENVDLSTIDDVMRLIMEKGIMR